MHEFLHVLKHTLLDSVKILPFLLIAYLIMEYIEHKTTAKTRNIIKKSGKFGPFIGSVLGAFPQCGFSVTATNLYAGRVITLGTLFAVYLSTSDEMLPILLSEGVAGSLILKILGIKILIGIIAGVIIDLILNKFNKNKKEENHIESICEHDHCHCEESIWKSAIKHTINVFVFILIISLVLNITIEYVGEDKLLGIISNKPILSILIAGLIGLIPNCASSVVLTQLYLLSENLPAMIGGLLVNAGVGLLVLFKVNHNQKENIKIVVLLYAIGVISAIVLQFLI
mgnify:CR=1 FL=1